MCRAIRHLPPWTPATPGLALLSRHITLPVHSLTCAQGAVNVSEFTFILLVPPCLNPLLGVCKVQDAGKSAGIRKYHTAINHIDIDQPFEFF